MTPRQPIGNKDMRVLFSDEELCIVRNVTAIHPCCGCCAEESSCRNCGDLVSGYYCSPFDAEICISCCGRSSNLAPEDSEWLDAYRLRVSNDAHNDRRGAIKAQQLKAK
jgi:hypothetical protein